MRKTRLAITGITVVIAFSFLIPSLLAYYTWSDWSYGSYGHVQIRVGGEAEGIFFTNIAIDFKSYNVIQTVVDFYAKPVSSSYIKVGHWEYSGSAQHAYYREAPPTTVKIMGTIVGYFYFLGIKWSDIADATLTVPTY